MCLAAHKRLNDEKYIYTLLTLYSCDKCVGCYHVIFSSKQPVCWLLQKGFKQQIYSETRMSNSMLFMLLLSDRGSYVACVKTKDSDDSTSVVHAISHSIASSAL